MAVQGSPSAHPQRFDLVVTGGLLADPLRDGPEPGDLAVHDGRIAAVGTPGTLDGHRHLDAGGLLVAPGLIDLHTHVYAPRTYLGVPADDIGVHQGVTTVVDAGSCGSDHWTDFSDNVVRPAATRVLSWLNISRHGLVHGRRELSRGPDDIDEAATEKVLRDHPDQVRGIKVRMSSSVLGDSGLAPLRAAKRVAARVGRPVMVHVGNEPPRLGDVLDLLGAGDVVTHAFHGKPGGLLGSEPEARAAVERGVRLDIGHGSASLSFTTAERALAAGFTPYTISTDLHARNTTGPVHSLVTTLNKLLALGLTPQQVIRCATLHAARVLGLDGELGTLRPGSAADLTLLRTADTAVTLTDSEGVTRTCATPLEAVTTLRAGAPVAPS
ncbi:amidohydrolase/deacetylase family metallohydrolase [Streptomyces longispororuber]|uniref:amidohydrolase/deacetylase family metallohydrolase n=1 Tax=Streptomyces longispororuber TaxID=68230 RepID=UPI00210D4E52|nr:amidohydrolase/deacetylase family metallohydrolase [Streptomyces longispororuber]MCQ4211220.1 amidohydrolase/deacetylase family metallohydrolase [Streptomyces longispororuber]